MFKPGDTVFTKASDDCYCAYLNKHYARPKEGPYTVEKVYKCGEHWRAVVTGDVQTVMGHCTRIDGNVSGFVTA